MTLSLLYCMIALDWFSVLSFLGWRVLQIRTTIKIETYNSPDVDDPSRRAKQAIKTNKLTWKCRRPGGLGDEIRPPPKLLIREPIMPRHSTSTINMTLCLRATPRLSNSGHTVESKKTANNRTNYTGTMYKAFNLTRTRRHYMMCPSSRNFSMAISDANPEVTLISPA